MLSFAFLLGLLACEKGKPPTVEKTQPPELAGASASVPESNPEAAREYARTHLPPGLKPGDFLTTKNDYPTGDTANVFRAVLDTLYIDSDSKPPLVVMGDSIKLDKVERDEEEATPQTIQQPIDAGPFGTAADSARARRATYPSDEEAAVYRAVLANHIQPADDKVLLVYATTTSGCSGPACTDEYYRHIRFEPEIMLATMENFLATRQQRLDLRDGFTAFRNAALLGDSAVKHLERETSRGNILENWDVIHRAWPTVEQVVQLSPVAFSPRHKQAMVEIARLDKNTFNRSVVVANKQPDGSWILVRFFYL